MKRTRNTAIVYVVLTTMAILFLFPFYWVVSSSVKSPECMQMAPPSFLPVQLVKHQVVLNTTGSIVTAEGGTWLKLVAYKNPVTKDKTGAFLLKLENSKPTQFVRWFADESFRRETDGKNFEQTTVVFENMQVGVFADAVERAILARTRTVSADGHTHEYLFVAEGSLSEVKTVRIFENPKYTLKTIAAPRWENLSETLEGPEASYGEKSVGFLRYLWNSFFITFLAVLGEILSASLVAYGFARVQFKGRSVLFAVLLATLMIPAQVTLIPLFSMYKSIGWLDTYLPLIVPHFTAGAFNVFLLRQYMLTLPKELDESANIDGCSLFQTYYRIILPNCIPALIVVGVFTFVGTWQDVMGPLIYLDSPELRTVPLGLEYFRSPYVDNRHLLMMGALLSMIPIAVLYMIFQRYIMSGIATTGMKE